MARALMSFNYLASLAAAFSIFCMEMEWFSNSPWWVPAIFIPIGWIMLVYLAMPFWYVLHILRGGKDDEAVRGISIIVNLVFASLRASRSTMSWVDRSRKPWICSAWGLHRSRC